MTQDEDFSHYLRERIDAVGPAITIDTTRVVRRARRGRAITRTAGALALTIVLGGAGWAVDTKPWNSPAITPAGHGSLSVAGKTGVDATATPTVDPADAGWPDAAFWHTTSNETDEAGQVHRHEVWRGHDEPGLIVDDGDLSTATGIGPSGWGNLVIDGTMTLVSWDVLYSLPTDPASLEALIRNSVRAEDLASSDPDHGAGNDDNKVFNMALDLVKDSPAPPPLRRALWEIMAEQPGAKVTTGDTDAAGRPGSLIDYSDTAGSRFVMVFDPDDGRLLEYRNPGASNHATLAAEGGPAADTPIEPTLESSGCVAWEHC